MTTKSANRFLALIWLSVIIAAIISVAGCATSPKSPQEAINQANAMLIASYQQVAANVKSGVMTDAERTETIAKLDKLAKDVDKAQELVNLGDMTKADNQIRLLNTAILELHKQIAEKARKQ